MGFAEAVKSGLNNFFNPSGRTSVSGFWWWALVLYVVGGVIGWFGGETQHAGGIEQTWLGIIFEILSFICLLALLFASIRRLHDTGKSAWYILFYFIPVVGWIIEIIFLCKSSQPGDNKYGPEPR